MTSEEGVLRLRNERRGPGGGARHADRGVQRGERREELLNAAIAGIRKHGPSASMDSLAAEAGITKPILYRHFGDRAGLVSAIADRFADTLLADLTTALSQSTARHAGTDRRHDRRVRRLTSSASRRCTASSSATATATPPSTSPASSTRSATTSRS